MKIKIKDPGSALTHFIAMLGAGAAAVPLLLKAAREPDHIHFAALLIFIVSMILLYAASTIYHTLDISDEVNKRLRKLDHMMIFILIAGTYTPVCLIVLGDRSGYSLLALVWGIAIAGIIINALWINCPKWFSSLIYIAMGWVCVLAIRQIILALPRAAFGWLLAGGMSPANFRQALTACRPDGVDCNSGVEDAPGQKDARAMTDMARLVEEVFRDAPADPSRRA